MKKGDLKLKIRASLFYLAIILILTCIIYSHTLFNDFAGRDDNDYIINNPDITEITLHNLKLIFSKFYVNCYLPLTMFMFMIEYKLFGLNPTYYHLINLILHLFNVCLVFNLINKLIESTRLNEDKIKYVLFIALLFGINPLHVESVAWVAELKDLLYSLFFMCSIYCYVLTKSDLTLNPSLKGERLEELRVKSEELNDKINNRNSFAIYYLLSIIFFVLSLLSKPTAITLTLVIILIDLHYSEGYTQVFKQIIGFTKTGKRYLLKYIPFILLSIAFAFINYRAQSSYGALEDTVKFNLINRVFMSSYSIVFYILKTFVPFNLSLAHPMPVKSGNFLPIVYYVSFAIVMIIAGIILLYYKYTKNKLIIFSSLFFIFTIILTINIIPFGRDIVAERYTYIPSIGLFIIFVTVVYDINNAILNNFSFSINKLKLFNLISILIFAAYISYLGVTTFERVKVWQSKLTLFTDVIIKHPEVPHAYAEIGIDFLFRQGKYEESIKFFNQAINLKPDLITALCNRGIAKNYSGYFYNAIEDFNKVIELNKNHTIAYANRSNSKEATGDYEGQLKDLNIAITLEPKNPSYYFSRAICENRLKQINRACEDIQKARMLGLKNENLNYLTGIYCR